jgi:hypothetical protein
LEVFSPKLRTRTTGIFKISGQQFFYPDLH